MPRKMTMKARAALPVLPTIPKGVLDELVSGPMTGEQVNATCLALKKTLIERVLGAELSHHLGCEGGPVSWFFNQLPMVNATGGYHDTLQVSMGNSGWRDVLNIPGMAVAAGVSYPGFIGQALDNAPVNFYAPVRVGRRRDEDRFLWAPAGGF